MTKKTGGLINEEESSHKTCIVESSSFRLSKKFDIEKIIKSKLVHVHLMSRRHLRYLT